MREYGKVSPTIWTGATGRDLRREGTEAIVVAIYLMTSPGSNMLGLYYQPLLYMAHETGLGIEGAAKGLAACEKVGFCRYDHTREIVWVVEMAAWQIAEELKASDKRCLGIQRDYEALPENLFLGDFFDRYARAFHLSNRRGGQGPLNPLPSKEQEQEQEQEKEREISATPQATPTASPASPGQLTLAVDNTKAGESEQSADDRIVDLVIGQYHDFLPHCRRIAVRNPKLRKRILFCHKLARQTLKEQKLNVPGARFWEAFFGECQDDEWLRGDRPNPNNPNWKQNLGVLLEEERFADIVNKAIARSQRGAA